MKKVFYIISVLSIFTNCKNKNSALNNLTDNYLDSMETLNLKKLENQSLKELNDSAKWLLYKLHYSDSCIAGKKGKNLIKTPLPFVKLKLVYTDRQNDSLYLIYNFIALDNIVIDKITGLKSITDGVILNTNTKSLIGFICGEAICNFEFRDIKAKELYESSYIEFLQKNQSKLNKWLFDEIIRRRIIRKF